MAANSRHTHTHHQHQASSAAGAGGPQPPPPQHPWSFDFVSTTATTATTSTPGNDNDNDNDNHHDNALTLPPINSNHASYLDGDGELHLPSLHPADFFDALVQQDPHERFSAFTSDDLPPPSNQLASRQQHAGIQFLDDLTSDLYTDELFAELFQSQTPPATEEDNHPRSTRDHASIIDLTASSPEMPPNRKRKLDAAGVASSAAAAPSKVRKETPKRNIRSATPRGSQESVEVVDLEDVEDKDQYEEFRAKQQAEAIRKQNEEEANKPVKLAEFQCIICMDNPTNLTVTHCGKLITLNSSPPKTRADLI
jgi:hypothetical protein